LGENTLEEAPKIMKGGERVKTVAFSIVEGTELNTDGPAEPTESAQKKKRVGWSKPAEKTWTGKKDPQQPRHREGEKELHKKNGRRIPKNGNNGVTAHERGLITGNNRQKKHQRHTARNKDEIEVGGSSPGSICPSAPGRGKNVNNPRRARGH